MASRFLGHLQCKYRQSPYNEFTGVVTTRAELEKTIRSAGFPDRLAGRLEVGDAKEAAGCYVLHYVTTSGDNGNFGVLEHRFDAATGVLTIRMAPVMPPGSLGLCMLRGQGLVFQVKGAVVKQVKTEYGALDVTTQPEYGGKAPDDAAAFAAVSRRLLGPDLLDDGPPGSA